VIIPGTTEFGLIIAGVATALRDARAERARLGTELETRLDAHPLSAVLTSMPGIGVRTAIKILTIIGDGSGFPTAGHLAAYAGLAPVTRRSGSSIKGETRSQRGNRALKNALFLSAFASLSDPTSRAYYDRKRAQGKRHNAALICLARRRTDVLYAMLRDRKPYQQPATTEPEKVTKAA
jgi:transposase